MKYQFIAEHAQEYPVTRQCQVLEIAVSGYYAWRHEQTRVRQQANAALLVAIQDIYQQNRRMYGSPRIHAELKKRAGHAVANGWHGSCGKPTYARCASVGIGCRLPTQTILIRWRPISSTASLRHSVPTRNGSATSPTFPLRMAGCIWQPS